VTPARRALAARAHGEGKEACVDEHDIRGLVGEVERGRLCRRAVIGIMVGAGFTALFARRLLTRMSRPGFGGPIT